VILWILTIAMTHGSTEYGYKFLGRGSCEKVGKELASSVRGKHSCKKKFYALNKEF
jgi:hypothetical protein